MLCMLEQKRDKQPNKQASKKITTKLQINQIMKQ